MPCVLVPNPTRHTKRARRKGDERVFDCLVQHGANVSALGNSDETPVGVAAMEDRFSFLWKLEAAGASLDVRNEYGGTVLMSAVHHGHADHVTRLLAKGLPWLDMYRVMARSATWGELASSKTTECSPMAADDKRPSKGALGCVTS